MERHKEIKVDEHPFGRSQLRLPQWTQISGVVEKAVRELWTRPSQSRTRPATEKTYTKTQQQQQQQQQQQ
ncbi:hypothetical protein Cob_v003980 [Colletotrichum orbiculare MAFF 240422]|uniref:Uncharacterized protein n=1 Tax=Colletotrichum orbiculare (strain 104-T / ATCC 96160 / CBS 514.97 / LARS 414 / MAFF 240422) TaxID=1213857 RepID=A0A484G0T7_COLOR|nr:hypothetical protein Cob_v003980 [Colletotrichum orbiculare MAFF 240422]